MLAVGGVRVRDAGAKKGRGVFAERAASIGAVLLRESAFAAVPRDHSTRCTQCLHRKPCGIDTDTGLGSSSDQELDDADGWWTCACQLMFCSRCWETGGDVHEQTSECQVLRAAGRPPDSAVLLGLRCYARVEGGTSSPSTDLSQFERLMRAPLDATLSKRASSLSDLLRHESPALPASGGASAEILISTLACNALSVGDHRGLAGSALFRGAAMLNHSCDPNAFVWFRFGGAEGRVVAEVRATRVIQPGQEVCIDVSASVCCRACNES